MGKSRPPLWWHATRTLAHIDGRPWRLFLRRDVRLMEALEQAVDCYGPRPWRLETVTPTNAENWFRHCGYRAG